MQAVRAVWQTTVMPSRASPLPQVLWHSQNSNCRKHCGSGLARDAGGAGCLVNHGDAFASKPAPTGFVVLTKFKLCRKHCGSEPARDAGGAVCLVNNGDAFASKPAPTGFVALTKFKLCRKHCGSELARDAGGAGCLVNHGDAFASKPAPTGFVALTKFKLCRKHCGSGLARDAGGAGCLANHGDAFASKPAPTGLKVLNGTSPSTPPFHPVHCRVRMVQQLLGMFAVFGVHGNADTGNDIQRVLANHDRLA